MAKCKHFIITDGCRHCGELQSKWYRTLRSKDFDDAECTRYTDRPLKVWHLNVLKNTTMLEIEITHDYYEKACELLHSFEFKDKITRRIWELHCEGLSRYKIELAIENLDGACKQSTIRSIIKQLERELNW